MAAVIEVSGLEKRYGDFAAVKGIDLEVNEGEIFAFLGPNGAGKTTTIEILEGFRAATAGTVRVLGEDPASTSHGWYNDVGIVLQDSETEPTLTPREAVTMHAAYYDDARPVDEVLSLVGLDAKADDRIKGLSGGQQRRLDLALALIGNPRLVFLDEPTTGFDPSARRESWATINALRDLGVTVMLTTHYMDEAQNLADRIAVIAAGNIIARGTAADLAEQVRARPTVSWLADDRLPPLNVITEGGRCRIEADDDDMVGLVHQLTSWAVEHDIELEELRIDRPTLEDTYLRLIGETDTADQPIDAISEASAS